MKHAICGVVAALAVPVLTGPAYADGCGPMAVTQVNPEPNAPLTLDYAIARASRQAPEVLISALEARAASADADQAGQPLNPSISLETENFAGTGQLRGFDGYETTLALEQTFRLGGKRELGERLGRAEAALAGAECDVQRLEAATLAGELFLDLRASIQMAEIADASADLADELVSVVQRRVNAGAAAPPELTRARTDLAVLQATADAARGDVEATALSLASLWGSAEVDFVLPDAGVNSLPVPQPTFEPGSDAHPRVAAATAEVTARSAGIDRERAEAWPDLTVSAGVRRFEDTGDSAFLAGVSLPLPIFDRNRDATRAAALRRDGAELNGQAVEARLRAKQAQLVARTRASMSRLQRLEAEALPLAEEAYSAAVKGYQVGKFGLTATLDARRSLIETRASVIDARLSLEKETLRLRALIGAAPFEGDF